MKFAVRILKYVVIWIGLRLKKIVTAKSIARAFIIYISTVTDYCRANQKCQWRRVLFTIVK